MDSPLSSLPPAPGVLSPSYSHCRALVNRFPPSCHYSRPPARCFAATHCMRRRSPACEFPPSRACAVAIIGVEPLPSISFAKAPCGWRPYPAHAPSSPRAKASTALFAAVRSALLAVLTVVCLVEASLWFMGNSWLRDRTTPSKPSTSVHRRTTRSPTPVSCYSAHSLFEGRCRCKIASNSLKTIFNIIYVPRWSFLLWMHLWSKWNINYFINHIITC
jgi:hypothetical protein